MEKKLSLFLGTISWTLLVLCSATQEEYDAMEKAVNSLSNIIGTYNTEFDMKVKFNVLQDAIDSVDNAKFGYQGEAKKNLDEISQLGKAAGRTYHECVNPVFEWCRYMNNTLGILTSHITDTNIFIQDRNTLWNVTVSALDFGLNQTSISLDLLDVLKSKLEPVKQSMDDMLQAVFNDFSNRLPLESRMWPKVQSVHFLFLFVVNIVVGSVGAAFNMLPIFANEGLADIVMDPRARVPIQKKWRAIEVFFQTLGEKFNYAKKIATEVDAALKEDHQNLNSLTSLINMANKNKYLFLADLSLRARIIPKLIYMGQKCHEYVIWHGYGSDEYLSNHVW